MGLNVKNIPLDTVYRFDTNKYVMATMLNETRGGNLITEKPKRFTEIYQFDMDGSLIRTTSGVLIDNPNLYDFEHVFAIKDYDNDMTISFKIPIHLQKVGLDELYELRAGIEKNYERGINK